MIAPNLENSSFPSIYSINMAFAVSTSVETPVEDMPIPM